MTTEERKQKKKELYALYEAYFEAQGINNPYFVPKPIRNEGDGEQYLAAAFFENELNVIQKTGEVYIENIDYRDMSRMDKDKYTLYKWTYNPYWKDPSEGYEAIHITSKNGETFTKYAVPIEEFTIVGAGKEYWESFQKNKAEELPLFDMSPISGVKPKHEPIDQSLAFGSKPLPTDEGMDTSMANLTARDFYALVHRKPISSIPGINEFINRENNI